MERKRRAEMSHFSVAVIHREDERLEDVLQPWHEFECTGIEDQYVRDVDDTDELREKWRGSELLRLRSPDGKLHDPYDDWFYRDPTAEEADAGTGTGIGSILSRASRDWGDGRGYRTKVRFVPDGWEEVKVPAPEIMSFREFVSYCSDRPEVPPGGRDLWGWTEVDEAGDVIRTVERTNPDARWDWWVVGGRWSGMLATRDGRTGVNSCRVRDLDLDQMTEKRWREALKTWDRQWPKTKAEIEGAADDDARKRALIWAGLYWGYEEGDTRKGYAARQATSGFETFAVVKDGQWYERGKMGWWATVSDGKSEDQWAVEFARLLRNADPELVITIVDCHI